MVNVDYNQTAFSFNGGIKYHKGFFILSIYISGIIAIVEFIIVIAMLIFGEYDDHTHDIYALCVSGGMFATLFIIGVAFKIYEVLVVKKNILKCINAEDAISRKALIFEAGTESFFMTRKRSKIGVRFTYGDKKVLMISKKYAVLRDYIDKECQIVYSESCDDVVVLKAEKAKKRK